MELGTAFIWTAVIMSTCLVLNEALIYLWYLPRLDRMRAKMMMENKP